MSYITSSWPVDITLTILLPLIVLYYFLTYKYNYWKDRNVKFAKPVLGFGCNLPLLLKKMSHADIIHEIYNQFEGERYCGFYQFIKPTLMIRDPKLIEQIMVKDFSHFEDRGLMLDEAEPLSVNLVNLRGDQWRNLRHKLTPTFSSGKLKGMFDQMTRCGEDLLQNIGKCADRKEVVEAKSLIDLFTSDVIASCAFGLQFKSDSPEGKKFRKMVASVITGNSVLRLGLRLFSPKLGKLLGIRITPLDATEYFIGITKASIEHRLKNNIKREDFFQLLLDLKNKDESGKQSEPEFKVEEEDIQLQYEVKPVSSANNIKLTDEVIAAQTFVFLVAGSESVASSLSAAIYYLAANPKVQERLQAEVDLALSKHGQWTYQAVKDMTYLDQFLQETMRMFPIAHFHLRLCTSPYKVPDSDLVVEEGTMLTIPTIGLQYDPKYHPNPEVFDPDRFEGNNYKPSPSFMPFGDGPRICIAMRFALLEMKVCVARIVSQYTTKLSSKTLEPLRYDPSSFNNRVLGGVWVSFEKRNRGT